MLSEIETDIIAITLEASLAGVHFVSFLLCLRWLIISDDGGTLRKPIQRPFLIVTLIHFAFTVTALCVGLQKVFSYSHHDGTTPTAISFAIINSIIETLTLITTDCVLIFRCWTVYNRSWRIILLPLLLFLYNISNLFVMAYCQWDAMIYKLAGNEPITLRNQINSLEESFYAANIVINIYATSAIVFRIWRNTLSRRFARCAIRFIAESCLLYALTSIAAFSTMFLSSPNGHVIATTINDRTAGIAFNLILIRVAQNRANPEPQLPVFIGDTTIERAIRAAPSNNSEVVTESTGGGA
ncbi:hypothetical protein F5887DRAFT_1074347 [Amanita rubescens]|nr:hypothetical protein F5887DRAFT_1074347 [Amanita rubescens]